MPNYLMTVHCLFKKSNKHRAGMPVARHPVNIRFKYSLVMSCLRSACSREAVQAHP